MEKLEKKKHDHKPTKILKFLIFMFVMFAPFFSILASTIYLQAHPEEKQTNVEINYKYESKTPQTLDTQVESFSNFIFKFNKTWYDYNNSIQTVAFDLTFYILRGYITFDTSYSSVEESVLDDNTLYPSKDITYSFNFDDNLNYININTSLVYSSITGATITYFSEDLVIQIDEFIYYYPQDLPVNYFFEYTDYNEIESVEVTETGIGSNVFEYSINKLNNNNIYNWSKETGIYTAIYNMTTGLGANETLAMLLAYWGILTAIYIVFDIVIELFIKLTHMFTE